MRRSVRIFLIVAAAALVVAATLALVARSLGNAEPSSSQATPIEGGDTSSPTAARSEAPAPSPTQDLAPSPAPTDQVQPEPSPSGPGTVTVVNWSADGEYVYASGIVTGDVGDAGSCTLTATSSSGQTLTGRRDAQSTPAAVNCGVIQIAAPSGDWTLVLTYQSEVASVSSEPTMVTQP